MKKREYIKPEIELLDSELQVILCVSGDNNKTGGNVDFDDSETEGQDIGTDTGGGTGGPV